jgi:hypothetical protein
MSGIWGSLLYILFPIPLALVILLSIPLPEFCRSFLRNVAVKISNVVFWKLPIPGISVSIFIVGMTASTFLFGIESMETINLQRRPDTLAVTVADRNCRRWRAERNFWISVLSVIAWLMLWRLRNYVSENERLKKELREATKTN